MARNRLFSVAPIYHIIHIVYVVQGSAEGTSPAAQQLQVPDSHTLSQTRTEQQHQLEELRVLQQQQSQVPAPDTYTAAALPAAPA